jgi:nicotinamidase-related amidase
VSTPTYDKSITALLVIDPYNDFISEGGKLWPRIKAVAEANNCVPHMLEVLNAARKAKLRVFYAMHHLMTEFELPFVDAQKSRDGKVAYWYFRRGGTPAARRPEWRTWWFALCGC